MVCSSRLRSPPRSRFRAAGSAPARRRRTGPSGRPCRPGSCRAGPPAPWRGSAAPAPRAAAAPRPGYIVELQVDVRDVQLARDRLADLLLVDEAQLDEHAAELAAARFCCSSATLSWSCETIFCATRMSPRLIFSGRPMPAPCWSVRRTLSAFVFPQLGPCPCSAIWLAAFVAGCARPDSLCKSAALASRPKPSSTRKDPFSRPSSRGVARAPHFVSHAPSAICLKSIYRPAAGGGVRADLRDDAAVRQRTGVAHQRSGWIAGCRRARRSGRWKNSGTPAGRCIACIVWWAR